MKNKLNPTMSHDACYAFTRLAVPLSFNNTTHFLGFESFARSDVTFLKYRFYHFKGLYWYCIIPDNGHVVNSLFFVGLPNCVRDFRSLCDSLEWSIEDPSGLSRFVSQYNLTHNERSV